MEENLTEALRNFTSVADADKFAFSGTDGHYGLDFAFEANQVAAEKEDDAGDRAFAESRRVGGV